MKEGIFVLIGYMQLYQHSTEKCVDILSLELNVLKLEEGIYSYIHYAIRDSFKNYNMYGRLK